MNQSLGKIITGMIKNENEEGYFVQKDGVTYLLAKKDLPEDKTFQLGEMVEGFCYINKHYTKKLTLVIPKIRIGHYAFGEVTEVNKTLGVFVNIGLPDKDVVVSMDTLPTIKSLWPKPGDQLMISLTIDEKDRMWGQLADEKIFRSMSRKGTDKQQNQNINGTIFRLKLAGSYLLTDDFYIGFIHPNERQKEPRLGEKVVGRVIGTNENGSLNISLLPRNYEAIPEDAQLILDFLENRQTKSMPYWDKTRPNEIEEIFHMSKARFKRALGHLMKMNRIKQEEGRTILLSSETNEQNE